MHIRFTLKDLLDAHRLGSHGILGELADAAGLHRHTVARIHGNRTRTVSIDVLEQLCDVLIAKGIPGDELPAGLFGRSALWDHVTHFAKAVTVYVAERTTEESAHSPASHTLSSDDVEVSTALFTHLSRVRAPAELRTCKVPFHVQNESHTRAGEDIEEAHRVFRTIEQSSDSQAHVIIGSQRSNLLLEVFLADLYGAIPFDSRSPVRTPFYLLFEEKSGLMLESCCAGVKVPGQTASSPKTNDKAAGIWYYAPEGWCHVPADRHPGMVVVRQHAHSGRVEIAIFGYSGRGTRLVGEAFFADPERFWKNSRERGHDGTRLATTLCEFAQSSTDPGEWKLEWTRALPPLV